MMETKLILNDSGSAFAVAFVPEGWPVRSVSHEAAEGSVSPMKLLLISFASCSGLTVNAFLKKFGKTVSAMEVCAIGEQHENPPKSFSHITLAFKICSPDAAEDDVSAAIGLAEKKYCPVWQTIAHDVRVETKIELSRP